jgi:hypothetical protein
MVSINVAVLPVTLPTAIQAYSIDQTCYVIHNNSNDVSHHGGIGRGQNVVFLE